MENAKIYIYDGSFNGFLTAMFVAFQRKETVADFRPDNGCQSTLFLETETISTHLDYAKRVWNGIQAKSALAVKQLYFSFLSEHPGIEHMLYRYIQNLFQSGSGTIAVPNDHVDLKIAQLSNQVAKEKEKWEAFLKFETSIDNVLYSIIAPHFNVLPLLSKHIRFRLKDREWLIYDCKRNYGLHSNGKLVEFIDLELWGLKGERIILEEHAARTNTDQERDWKTILRGLPLKCGIEPQARPNYASMANSDFFGARKAV